MLASMERLSRRLAVVEGHEPAVDVVGRDAFELAFQA